MFFFLSFSSFGKFRSQRPKTKKVTILQTSSWGNHHIEVLVVVVNRVTCSVPVPGSTLYVHACHPRGALPAPGLAGCPVGRGE